MEFWYFLNARYQWMNPNVISVFVLQSKKGDKHHTILELATNNTTNGMKWQSATAEIKTQEHFSIGIQAVIKNIYYYPAIDDIVFKQCASTHPPMECSGDEWMCVEQDQCIKTYQHCDGKYDCKDKSDEFQCQSQYGDCNFDSPNWMEECQWESKNLDFEWSRAKTGRNSETGPKRNQNPRQEGYFLYIDSSKQVEGRQAGIKTPTFKASQGTCYLRFWYTMNGSPSLGTLEVFSEGNEGQTFPVWRMIGNQGEEWKYGLAQVGNSHEYSISFIATRGGDNSTDIAIDEVKFTPGCKEGGIVIPPDGRCSQEDFFCKLEKKCIPGIWKCDCDWDCDDGSDEVNCPVTCISTGAPKQVTTPVPVGTPIPQGKCKPDQKECLKDKKCIPALYLCDGIEDCSDGSDEKFGCDDSKLCGEKFYFCKDRASPPCVSREVLCDGKPDCSDGSDESLCDTCRKDFCKNGANCSVINHKPICKCTGDYMQNRCSKIRGNEELDRLKRSQQAGVGWIVGVVIGTILLVGIGLVIWYKRNTNAERSRLPHAVDNPVYGLNLDTLTFGELNSHMPVRKEDDSGATAIENPLFAFKSEIK